MSNLRAEGLRVFREMLPGTLPDGDVEFGGFAPELMEIGVESVFGRLWTREGLSRRDRSLVTLGILIALRATDEMKAHFQIARHNGLSDDELAEVIYHASGYAGFPAAASARTIAAEVLA
ncbi:carboxymuconolactone decarboxylase family protein [Mycobacterium sp. shizuoka-1]|uniref:carboxymuconolactone decarboxylase family protein n=1 Tax=Mycobacterium sp. shizuoka-1 TaxID=2039281 RepID=UPI000C065A00|nr:carboxymuconolactone decarboxylase family protein [Mycobacterium sp. shizuoka-1]GAY13720.1 4-carboxymuconolactone decarboxylase [Mycobacterium sp. shizuoka-1]